MPVIRRPREGTIQERMVIVDKDDKGGKNPLYKKEKVDTIPVKGTERGSSVAMIRDVASLKLSLDWNSVMVEVGVEMPWPVKPGDLEAVRQGMDKVERLVSKRMEKKSAELKQVLKDLRGKGR